MSKPWIDALVDLGFTALEAEIYGALAQGQAQTGYRVAQLIGKPVANVYKALETLHGKGAILVDESNTKMVRAVPTRELLRLLQRDFEERRRRATDALGQLPTGSSDRRIYELGSRPQVLERARTMLKRARRMALLDIGNEHLLELAGDLERAAHRGIDVTLRTDRPRALTGVDVVVIAPRGAPTTEPWPGSWLTLVVDGAQHLLAVFDASGQLRQGTYSASPFLSWVFHSGIAAEITVDVLARALEKARSARDLRSLLDTYRRLIPADAPGRRELLADLKSTADAAKERTV